MTDKQILQKAIEKAEQNGFDMYSYCEIDKGKYTRGNIFYVLMTNYRYMTVLFSHDFAKAFWKNEYFYCKACRINHSHSADCDAGCYGNNYKGWEFHLQEMVLEKEPLKYIKRFLK